MGGGGGGTCVSACLFVETFFLVRLRLSARLLLFRNVKHFNYEQHAPLLYYTSTNIRTRGTEGDTDTERERNHM